MKNDFDVPDDFADFVDELAADEKNANACSIDNPECEGCGSKCVQNMPRCVTLVKRSSSMKN